MKKMAIILIICLLFLGFCSQSEDKQQLASKKLDKQIDSIIPIGSQGLSLSGKSLIPAPPSAKAIEQYNKAKIDYEKDLTDPETLIWYGRRTAYLGKYLDAIKLFSRGINLFPQDPRFRRHRGHRYISLRKFDLAITDFLKAVTLIKGKEDEVEPDGMPNAKNIPVSTLHHNIWYHLGLAYYLKNDLNNALNAYNECLRVSTNDDGLVSSIQWLYMILRRLNQKDEVRSLLSSLRVLNSAQS